MYNGQTILLIAAYYKEARPSGSTTGIHVAKSNDGIHFEIEKEPLFDKREWGGDCPGNFDCWVIDPRVTKIDDTDYYIDSQLRVSSDENYTEHLNFVSCHSEREGDYANFFFISKHAESNIPGLNIIQKLVPYPVFILCYLIGFFFASSFVFLVAYVLRKGLTATPRSLEKEKRTARD